MIEPNWKEIAGHLYDELRLRGIQAGECLCNHKNLCGCIVIDCIHEFEQAEIND
jgi:hypothetical protein